MVGVDCGLVTDRRLEALALRVATDAHEGQTRKGTGKVPYIQHPIEVAELLRECGHGDDSELIAAALLHDTIEDCNLTFAYLNKHFGLNVAYYVDQCTTPFGITGKDKFKYQSLVFPYLCEQATLIKIADKTCNMRDLVSRPPPWKLERKREYAHHAYSLTNETTSPVWIHFEEAYNDVMRAEW